VRCWGMLCLVMLFSSCATPRFTQVQFIKPGSVQQMVEVVPVEKGSFHAVLTAWDLNDDGTWRRTLGPWPAVIGAKGLAPAGEKREGDGRSPSGMFPLRTAFGKAEVIKTGLHYRRVNSDDFWVDDPASADYNRWVQGVPKAASYEKMLRSDGLYDVGAVIEYNTDPVVPGNGSAIFMHIWLEGGTKPTSGCVALDRIQLLRLLDWLQVYRKPAVFLVEPKDKTKPARR
ncbi:MAG: L,D-transpeptidase family protein, partial [Candidatus Omnitrophica bacterium]|nr:L,D-transpeptidase family protein [Candidatus Omnitrophota bacterium]